MLLAFMFYNIQPFLFPCIRVDQQGWLPQRKSIGHSLILCAATGKFRVIYGQQHIGAIEAPNLCRPISLDLLFNIAAVLNVEPAKLLTFRE